MGWPWDSIVPLTKEEWRACLCQYILDHEAAFSYIRSTIWDTDQPVRDIVRDLQAPFAWMQFGLLHIAAWYFAHLKIPGRYFAPGQPAHVRVWHLDTLSFEDVHLCLKPPCNLDGWRDPNIPSAMPLENEARRRYKSLLRSTRHELHERILHAISGVRKRMASGVEPPIYDVVIAPAPINSHFVYLAPSVWYDDTTRLEALLPSPGIVPDVLQMTPDANLATNRKSPRKVGRRGAIEIKTMPARAIPIIADLPRIVLPDLLQEHPQPLLCGQPWLPDAVGVCEVLLQQACKGDTATYTALRRHESAEEHGFGTSTWFRIPPERTVANVLANHASDREHELRVEHESAYCNADETTQNLPSFVTSLHTKHAPSRRLWSAVQNLLSTVASRARYRIVATAPGDQLPDGTRREEDWAWAIVLMGTKQFRLLPPDPAFDALVSGHDIDEAPTLRPDTFPQAPWLQCDVTPGQVLFIPPGWWYTVNSSDRGSVMLVIALDIDAQPFEHDHESHVDGQDGSDDMVPGPGRSDRDSVHEHEQESPVHGQHGSDDIEQFTAGSNDADGGMLVCCTPIHACAYIFIHTHVYIYVNMYVYIYRFAYMPYPGIQSRIQMGTLPYMNRKCIQPRIQIPAVPYKDRS